MRGRLALCELAAACALVVSLLLGIVALHRATVGERRTRAFVEAMQKQREGLGRVGEIIAGPLGGAVGRILDAPGAGGRRRSPRRP